MILYDQYMIDRRLRVLAAIARHGTVTAAAEVCRLTPSAVSHQMQALARELDVALLEPVGRGVRLTPAAHTLLEHGETGMIPESSIDPLDMESLAVSKANTKVGDTPIKMVVMGDAYLQRDQTDKPNRFVCLLSDKGKVVLTFFTEQ